MNFASEAPINDAAILDSFALVLDPTINWCEICKTPSNLVDRAATHLEEEKREIEIYKEKLQLLIMIV